MKRAMGMLAAGAALTVLAAVGCAVGAGDGDDTATTVSTFEVAGMTCSGCEAGVRIKVGRLAGVESVEASYRNGTARVVYDPVRVTSKEIVAAIEELGYEASLQRGGTAGDG